MRPLGQVPNQLPNLLLEMELQETFLLEILLWRISILQKKSIIGNFPILQEIRQQLLDNNHTFAMGQCFNLAPYLKNNDILKLSHAVVI